WSPGALNLSGNEEVGLLVDGYETPPMVLMGHDQPYVAERVEAQGYVKAKDLYAWLYDIRIDVPAAVPRRTERARRPGITAHPPPRPPAPAGGGGPAGRASPSAT